MNDVVTDVEVERSVAESLLSESRAFATAQQAFETALRSFVDEQDTLSNSNLNALREYLLAKAAGETPNAPEFLADLDVSALEGLASTARSRGQALSGSLQSNEIADAAGATSIIEKITRNVARNHDEENLDELLNISGADRYERALEYAISPDNYNRDAARSFISDAYEYQRKAERYQTALERFAENNDLTPAQTQELNLYMRSLTDGDIPPRSALITRLADADERRFNGLSEGARELNEAGATFTASVNNLARVDSRFTDKAPALMASIEQLSRDYDDETKERILDTVINRTIAPNTARGLRETGWPDGTDASYELGRRLLNMPQSAGDWFTDLFDGIGGDGEGNGNGLPWQGLLGGLLGGGGGFLIGRMFGGGIIGTIASAALGIMGAYMGYNFANRNFGGGSNNENGQTASELANQDPGPRNIRIPDGRGGVQMVNAQEHQQYLYQLASGSGVRPAEFGVRYSPEAEYSGAAPVGINMRTDNVSLQF